MKTKSRLWFKSVSLILAVTFFVQDLGFAAFEAKPIDFSLFPSKVLNVKFPESIAHIEDSYKAPSDGKTVILFQSAHTNESGQLNLSKALDILLEKEKIKHVFIEAGTGNDSISFLREKASPEKRKRVGLSYIKKGELSGAEYLDLTSNHAFTLWGVEDKDLYWKSIDVYRSVADGREKLQDYLSRVDITIKALKTKIFNPSLISFDDKSVAYQKEEISLTDYFVVLTSEADKRGIDLRYFPHLDALRSVKEKEEKIDFRIANEEQAKALASLPQEDIEALALAQEDSLRYSPFKLSGVNRKEEKAFYTLLEEKVKNLKEYLELAKYIDYLKEFKKIDARTLLEEQRNLEEQIYASLAKKEDEAKLHQADRNLRNLKRLFNLTLTPDEFFAYKEDAGAYDIAFITGFLNKKIMDLKNQYERVVFLEEGYERYMDDAEKFYELTYERDKAFVQNALKKMNETGEEKAVLVVGGYHTPNLKAILKKENISYVCVTPQVLHETNQKRYEKILLNQKTEARAKTSGENTIDVLPMVERAAAIFEANVVEPVIPGGASGATPGIGASGGWIPQEKEVLVGARLAEGVSRIDLFRSFRGLRKIFSAMNEEAKREEPVNAAESRGLGTMTRRTAMAGLGAGILAAVSCDVERVRNPYEPSIAPPSPTIVSTLFNDNNDAVLLVRFDVNQVAAMPAGWQIKLEFRHTDGTMRFMYVKREAILQFNGYIQADLTAIPLKQNSGTATIGTWQLWVAQTNEQPWVDSIDTLHRFSESVNTGRSTLVNSFTNSPTLLVSSTLVQNLINNNWDAIMLVQIDPTQIASIPDGGSVQLQFTHTDGTIRTAYVPKTGIPSSGYIQIDLRALNPMPGKDAAGNPIGGSATTGTWTLTYRAVRNDAFSIWIDPSLSTLVSSFTGNPTLVNLQPTIVTQIFNDNNDAVALIRFDLSQVSSLTSGSYVKLEFRHPDGTIRTLYISRQGIIENNGYIQADLTQADPVPGRDTAGTPIGGTATTGTWSLWVGQTNGDEFSDVVDASRTIQVDSFTNGPTLAGPTVNPLTGNATIIQSLLNNNGDAVILVTIDPNQIASIPNGGSIQIRFQHTDGTIRDIYIAKSDIPANGILQIDLTKLIPVGGIATFGLWNLLVRFTRNDEFSPLISTGLSTAISSFTNLPTLPTPNPAIVQSLVNTNNDAVALIRFDVNLVASTVPVGGYVKLEFRHTDPLTGFPTGTTRTLYISRQGIIENSGYIQANLLQTTPIGGTATTGSWNLFVGMTNGDEFSDVANTGLTTQVNSFVDGPTLADPNANVVQSLLNNNNDAIVLVTIDPNQIASIPNGGVIELRFTHTDGTIRTFYILRANIPGNGIMQLDLSAVNPIGGIATTGVWSLSVRHALNDEFSNLVPTAITTAITSFTNNPTLPAPPAALITQIQNTNNDAAILVQFDTTQLASVPDGGYVKLSFTHTDGTVRTLYISKTAIIQNNYFTLADLTQATPTNGTATTGTWTLSVGQTNGDEFSPDTNTGLTTIVNIFFTGPILPNLANDTIVNIENVNQDAKILVQFNASRIDNLAPGSYVKLEFRHIDSFTGVPTGTVRYIYVQREIIQFYSYTIAADLTTTSPFGGTASTGWWNIWMGHTVQDQFSNVIFSGFQTLVTTFTSGARLAERSEDESAAPSGGLAEEEGGTRRAFIGNIGKGALAIVPFFSFLQGCFTEFTRGPQSGPQNLLDESFLKHALRIPANHKFRTTDPRQRVGYPMIDFGPHWTGPSAGGIGTGSFRRNLFGQTTGFIFSTQPLDETLTGSQISVWQRKKGTAQGYALPLGKRAQGDTRLSSWNWQAADKVASEAVYRGLHPFSSWEYPVSQELPAKVTVRQFSPFIPGDLTAATEPVSITEVEVANPSKEEVEVSVMLSAEHFAGWQIVPDEIGKPREHLNHFEKTSDGQTSQMLRGLTAPVLVMQSDNPLDQRLAGGLAIATERQTDAVVTYHTAFDVQDTGADVWDSFSGSGVLKNADILNSNAKEQAGAIAVKVTLKPGETRVIPFALAWDIPKDVRNGKENLKAYTTRYDATGKNAHKIALKAIENRKVWARKIQEWQKAILENKQLPDHVKQTLINELYFLVDGGSLLTPEGQFLILESIDYRIHNTLDVWYYSSMLGHFFPQLEETFMLQFASLVDTESNESVNFWNRYPARFGFPEDKELLAAAMQKKTGFDPKVFYKGPVKHKGAVPHHLDDLVLGRLTYNKDGDDFRREANRRWQNHNPWKDLNPKFVLMAWRAYKMGGAKNVAFLKKIWPAIQSALAYQKKFDQDGDGLPDHEDFPDQTYDTLSLKGAATYTAVLTMQALVAANKIGKLVGDESHQEEYAKWLEQGNATIQKKLWNGTYFKADEHQDHVMADAMSGILYADLYGLDPVLPKEQVLAHLKTVYRKNFKGFAGGKVGMVNVVGPDGKTLGEKEGDIQADEVWVGVQRFTAALMWLRGMKKEAFEVLEIDYENTWKDGYQFQTPEGYDILHKFRASVYMRAGSIFKLLEAVQKSGARLAANSIERFKEGVNEGRRVFVKQGFVLAVAAFLEACGRGSDSGAEGPRLSPPSASLVQSFLNSWFPDPIIGVVFNMSQIDSIPDGGALAMRIVDGNNANIGHTVYIAKSAIPQNGIVQIDLRQTAIGAVPTWVPIIWNVAPGIAASTSVSTSLGATIQTTTATPTLASVVSPSIVKSALNPAQSPIVTLEFDSAQVEALPFGLPNTLLKLEFRDPSSGYLRVFYLTQQQLRGTANDYKVNVDLRQAVVMRGPYEPASGTYDLYVGHIYESEDFSSTLPAVWGIQVSGARLAVLRRDRSYDVSLREMADDMRFYTERLKTLQKQLASSQESWSEELKTLHQEWEAYEKNLAEKAAKAGKTYAKKPLLTMDNSSIHPVVINYLNRFRGIDYPSTVLPEDPQLERASPVMLNEWESDPLAVASDYIQQAKSDVASGKFAKHLLWGGQAMRAAPVLGGGAKSLYRLGQFAEKDLKPYELDLRKDDDPSKGQDTPKLFSDFQKKLVTMTHDMKRRNDRIGQYLFNLSLGAHEVIQYRVQLEGLAREMKTRESEIEGFVKRNGKFIVSVNSETGDEIVREWIENNFFGFDRENVIFVTAKKFPVYVRNERGELVQMSSTISEEWTLTQPLEHVFGHGLIRRDMNIPHTGFIINEKNERNYKNVSPYEYMEQRGAEIVMNANVEDIPQLTEESLPFNRIGLFLSLRHNKKAQAIFEGVENPKGNKGGYLVKRLDSAGRAWDMTVEGHALKSGFDELQKAKPFMNRMFVIADIKAAQQARTMTRRHLSEMTDPRTGKPFYTVEAFFTDMMTHHLDALSFAKAGESIWAFKKSRELVEVDPERGEKGIGIAQAMLEQHKNENFVKVAADIYSQVAGARLAASADEPAAPSGGLAEMSELIIVPGHGVYKGVSKDDTPNDSTWVGIFPGEGPFYAEHVQKAVELASSNPQALIVFSGGQTRPAAGQRSEAESYFDIALQSDWWGHPELARRALKEEFARDSLENVLNSILLFQKTTGRLPGKVMVLGWGFKEERFKLHAQAIGIPVDKFIYIGVNNPQGEVLEKATAGERKKIEATRIDPLLIGPEWEGQRQKRDPFKRGRPYSADLETTLTGIKAFYQKPAGARLAADGPGIAKSIQDAKGKAIQVVHKVKKEGALSYQAQEESTHENGFPLNAKFDQISRELSIWWVGRPMPTIIRLDKLGSVNFLPSLNDQAVALIEQMIKKSEPVSIVFYNSETNRRSQFEGSAASVEPRADYTLVITWVDGSINEINLRDNQIIEIEKSSGARLADHQKTTAFLTQNPFEMGLHTVTGGKAFATVDKSLLVEFAKVVMNNKLMPALDDLDVLTGLNEAGPQYQNGIKAFLFGKDLNLALQAAQNGADVLLGDENLPADIIKAIKEKHAQVLVWTEVSVLNKPTVDILSEITGAVQNGVDGVLLKPYAKQGVAQITPGLLEEIKKAHPGIILVVAGGVFENKVAEVLSLPVKVVTAFGVNKLTLPEFEAQVASYKAEIGKGTGARLAGNTIKNEELRIKKEAALGVLRQDLESSREFRTNKPLALLEKIALSREIRLSPDFEDLIAQNGEALKEFALEVASVTPEVELRKSFALSLDSETPSLFRVALKGNDLELVYSPKAGEARTILSVTNSREAIAAFRVARKRASQDTLSAQGLLTLVKLSRVEAETALPAQEFKGRLGIDISIGRILSLIENKDDFESQVNILFTQILELKRQSKYKNATFFINGLDKIKTPSRVKFIESMLERNSSIKTGEPVGFDVVVKLGDPDEIAQAQEKAIHKNIVYIPVGAIEESDIVHGWNQLFVMGHTAGSFYGGYLNTETKAIEFHKAPTSFLGDLFRFYRSHVDDKSLDLGILAVIFSGNANRGVLNQFRFSLPKIQKIAYELMISIAHSMLKAVGGAA